MRQCIPRGLTREHVLLALADLDAGFPHPFGEPTKYELVYRGKRYAPKAVMAGFRTSGNGSLRRRGAQTLIPSCPARHVLYGSGDLALWSRYLR
jgi:hypothetical protein